MKINLQLFAEEATESTAASTEQEEKATETKPTENNTSAASGKEPDGKPKAEAKYTDADVDEILNKKFAEWQKKQQKAVDEAEKLATMNATQRAEYERDQLKKELEARDNELNEYKRQATLAEMSKTARKMLADEGINVTDELLSVLVTTDAEQTKTAVDGFAKLFKDSVENTVKERLKGTTPKAGTAGATVSASEAEINKRIKKYEI